MKCLMLSSATSKVYKKVPHESFSGTGGSGTRGMRMGHCLVLLFRGL